MPDITKHLYVTTDGGTYWLQCFSENPTAEHGEPVIELAPGTKWAEVFKEVLRHTCPGMPEPTDIDTLALDAAMGVFDRTMHLMAPHRIFVEEALRAAGDVYAAAMDAEVDRMMGETGFIAFDVTEEGPRLRLKLAADLARSMVAAFDELVTQHGCENYVEWESTITDPAREEAGDAGVPVEQWPPHRRYKLIVVKPNGKSPHELRLEAEEQRDVLAARLDDVMSWADQEPKRRIVTICGSTKFRQEMTEANRRLTMAGFMVLAPGVFGHDGDICTQQEKEALDTLHRDKIDVSWGIYVVNPGGYIGESTRAEIEYAAAQGKNIQYQYLIESQAGADA